MEVKAPRGSRGKAPRDLNNLLDVEEFGTAKPIAKSDPLGPTPMVLSPAVIELYDRNPRRSKNRQYEDIKHSLEKRGFEGVLLITRRPGSEHYMVSRGGNTTLTAIKELLEQGDPRFQQIRCEFHPWSTELQTLMAHIIENDARDDLIWWDKARSIRDARDLLLDELGEKSLSSRKLSAALAERGHKISHTALALMDYTVDVLEAVIPAALSAGAGRGQVEKIRALQNAGRSLWADRLLGTEEAFDDLFNELCKKSDAESAGDTVAERIRANLEEEFASLLDTTKRAVAAELGARLDGRRADNNQEPVTGDNTPGVTARYSGEPGIGDGDTEGDAEPTTDKTSLPSSPRRSAKKGVSFDLPAARVEAAVIARRFAAHFGIEELVLSVEAGCGFLLTGIPDREELDESFSMACHAWWTLCACSEQTAVPDANTRLAPDSVLRDLLSQETLEALQCAIETYDPGAYGRLFWAEMGDEAWQDLRALLSIYRQIRRLAAERDIALW